MMDFDADADGWREWGAWIVAELNAEMARNGGDIAKAAEFVQALEDSRCARLTGGLN
jgi:hypothetical protein